VGRRFRDAEGTHQPAATTSVRSCRARAAHIRHCIVAGRARTLCLGLRRCVVRFSSIVSVIAGCWRASFSTERDGSFITWSSLVATTVAERAAVDHCYLTEVVPGPQHSTGGSRDCLRPAAEDHVEEVARSPAKMIVSAGANSASVALRTRARSRRLLTPLKSGNRASTFAQPPGTADASAAGDRARASGLGVRGCSSWVPPRVRVERLAVGVDEDAAEVARSDLDERAARL
jgi:hypothetical protein